MPRPHWDETDLEYRYGSVAARAYSAVSPLLLGRFGIPRIGQHRHPRSPAELIAGKRGQPRRLGTVFRHRPGKPQGSRTTIRGHRRRDWLAPADRRYPRTRRRAPVRIDLDIHIHELVAVVALFRPPAPPGPRLLSRGGRR